MSLNGSGVAVINSLGQPVVASTLITAAVFNAFSADIATMLSTALFKDGQQTVTAHLPMNSFKLTGLGPATARTDAASLANIQDGTGVYVATVGGTADAITLTPAPAIAAYAAGQTFRFIASGQNTGATTVAVSGLTAKAVTKNGAAALLAGDIPSGALVELTYNGTSFSMGIPGINFVTITGTQTLTNKTLTAPAMTDPSMTNPVFSTIINTGTLTLPTSSDTLVGRATTDTLSNKSLGSPLITTPTLSGTIIGTYTLGGTPTIPGVLVSGTPTVLNPYAVNSIAATAHGLGATPHIVIAYAECLSADIGYSTGDRVYFPGDLGSTSGFNVAAEANNCVILTNSANLSMLNKGAPAGPVAATSANWKLVVQPFKLT